jgi:hypothetical protein
MYSCSTLGRYICSSGSMPPIMGFGTCPLAPTTYGESTCEVRSAIFGSPRFHQAGPGATMLHPIGSLPSREL